MQKKSDEELGVLFNSKTGKAGNVFKGIDSKKISKE